MAAPYDWSKGLIGGLVDPKKSGGIAGNLGGLGGLLKIGGIVGSLLPNKSKKTNKILQGLGRLGEAMTGFDSKTSDSKKIEAAAKKHKEEFTPNPQYKKLRNQDLAIGSIGSLGNFIS
tara:strand:+ start:60 stop:413 length:354 start_codon:yes stop_codon:yes gene_type:complete